MYTCSTFPYSVARQGIFSVFIGLNGQDNLVHFIFVENVDKM